MNESRSTNKGMLRFLVAGTFTDFQIRTNGYNFNVHRNVIAANSKYFENICDGKYKEAEQGYVSLDEKPIFVALLIHALYTGSYGYQDDHTISQLLKNALVADGTTHRLLPNLYDILPWTLHATMFGLGESFESPTVVAFATSQFEGMIDSELAPLTLIGLLDAVDLIYNQRPTISDALRARATFWAQNSYHDLVKLPNFYRVFSETPTFAWDFAVKYGRASWLFCATCKKEAILKDCDCGLRGLCHGKHCSDGDTSSWTCKGCGSFGELQKDRRGQPRIEWADMAEMKVKDSFNSTNDAMVYAKTSPGRKRRSP